MQYSIHAITSTGINYTAEVSVVMNDRIPQQMEGCNDLFMPWAPLYLHGLTLIPAWTSNYIHYILWGEITHPFLNFNGATVEV